MPPVMAPTKRDGAKIPPEPPEPIEEPDIVVLLLERLDFAFDEIIQLLQVILQVPGYIEIHGVLLASWKLAG